LYNPTENIPRWIDIAQNGCATTPGAGELKSQKNAGDAQVDIQPRCIDQRAKIPDYKITAVKIEKTAPPEGWDAGYQKPLTDRGAIKEPVQVH
jgi:hypothetical protein